MRRFVLVAAVAALSLTFSSAFVRANADETKAAKATTNKFCPVMGEEGAADPNIRVEYKGQYVYFCCDACAKMFEKNPDKYLATMSKEELEAIKVNDTCPVMMSKIEERNVRVEHNGRLVYFCCAGCIKPYKQKNGIAD